MRQVERYAKVRQARNPKPARREEGGAHLDFGDATEDETPFGEALREGLREAVA